MSHYFDEVPAGGSRRRAVTLDVPGLHAELLVDRGVFAASGVDAGTVELLRAQAGPPSGAAVTDVLDLGCGYGPVAVTVARRYPDATVWAVDVNSRALELTAANADRLGLTARVRPALPDDVPAGLRFDAMWSNPPIRVGKTVLHEMLDRWLPRLAPGASAWLVVQKNLGSDSLAAWLTAGGWPTKRLGSRKGYRILQVGPA